MSCLVYATSIHLAWTQESMNHDRVSHQSQCFLQTTRTDLATLKTVDLDPAAEMVTLILDVITDKTHFHLVKGAAEAEAEGAGAEEAEAGGAGAGAEAEEAELAQSKRAALACMADEDTSGHVVSNEEVAALAAELSLRRHKDAVPLPFIADAIAGLAGRSGSLGQQMLHILLLGCNTIQLVGHLKESIPEALHSRVWVLCTSEVWPSDCSTMLWHLYGALARPDDMNSFRAGTRTLLGEYTDHYARQHIIDPSRADLKLSGSLANAVHCDRLDRVVVLPGQGAQMELL